MYRVGLQEPGSMKGQAQHPWGNVLFLVFHSERVLCCSGQPWIGCGAGPGVPVQARHPTLTPHPIPTGPIEQLPDYNRIRSGMFWLRF